MIRTALLMLAQFIAWLILLPFLLWSRLPLPEYSAFTAPSQLLALVPGFLGVLLRRVWYRSTLRACGTNLTVDWLAVIRTRQSEVGNRCTFGVANWVGWVRVGDNVITGSHVSLISGAKQHNFSDIDRPIREQHGEKRQTVIGDDSWIGANVVVLADIAPGSVVGAGSVVTKKFDANAIIAGNPARLLRYRSMGIG